MQEIVHKEWGEPFILHPGELVLAATLEYFVLPRDIAGQLVTRSSYGRLGLMTATAIQIQPGSEGVVTLELVNLGQTPIALRAGQRIGQLTFHGLSNLSWERPISHTYRRATGPEFSLIRHDWDLPIISGILQELSTEYVASGTG
jgi:deoxycytidine triphosphate deaminase